MLAPNVTCQTSHVECQMDLSNDRTTHGHIAAAALYTPGFLSIESASKELPMTARTLHSTFCVSLGIALCWMSSGALQAQAPAKAANPAKPSAVALRTPDGKPDLQGTWSFATLTPLERPANLAGKEFFTEQEATAWVKQQIAQGNMDRRDGPVEQDVGRAYNDFWWDRGTTIVKTRRTSLVIDPTDGKIPPMLPAARERQQERAAANRGHEFDGPEN